MPRFFFDTLDNGARATDPTGAVLANDAAVRRHALVILGEVARRSLFQDGDHHVMSIEVFDERRSLVLAAYLSMMVTYAQRR